jgi:hypothetical protein
MDICTVPGCLNIRCIDVFAGSVGDSFFNSFNAKTHPIKTVLEDEPQPQQQQQQHSLDNCFTSFMGSTSLPFDIQVCLFFRENILFIALVTIKLLFSIYVRDSG